jgi:hypothetical protein
MSTVRMNVPWIRESRFSSSEKNVDWNTKLPRLWKMDLPLYVSYPWTTCGCEPITRSAPASISFLASRRLKGAGTSTCS